MSFTKTVLLMALNVLCVFGVSGFVKAGENPVALKDWMISHKEGVVSGKVRLINQGNQRIGVGGMRLRVTDFARETIAEGPWVTFKGMAPGKTRSRTFDGIKADETNLIWLDVRYILVPDEEKTHQDKVANIYIRRVLNKEKPIEEVAIASKAAFVSLAGGSPVAYTKKVLKKVLAAYSLETPAKTYSDGEPEGESDEGVSLSNQISFLKVRRITDDLGQTMVEIKLHNDLVALPANRLHLAFKFYDGSGLVKELSFKVPTGVGKGDLLLRVPAPGLTDFIRWQGSYAY